MNTTEDHDVTESSKCISNNSTSMDFADNDATDISTNSAMSSEGPISGMVEETVYNTDYFKRKYDKINSSTACMTPESNPEEDKTNFGTDSFFGIDDKSDINFLTRIDNTSTSSASCDSGIKNSFRMLNDMGTSLFKDDTASELRISETDFCIFGSSDGKNLDIIDENDEMMESFFNDSVASEGNVKKQLGTINNNVTSTALVNDNLPVTKNTGIYPSNADNFSSSDYGMFCTDNDDDVDISQDIMRGILSDSDSSIKSDCDIFDTKNELYESGCDMSKVSFKNVDSIFESKFRNIDNKIKNSLDKITSKINSIENNMGLDEDTDNDLLFPSSATSIRSDYGTLSSAGTDNISQDILAEDTKNKHKCSISEFDTNDNINKINIEDITSNISSETVTNISVDSDKAVFYNPSEAENTSNTLDSSDTKICVLEDKNNVPQIVNNTNYAKNDADDKTNLESNKTEKHSDIEDDDQVTIVSLNDYNDNDSDDDLAGIIRIESCSDDIQKDDKAATLDSKFVDDGIYPEDETNEDILDDNIAIEEYDEIICSEINSSDGVSSSANVGATNSVSVAPSDPLTPSTGSSNESAYTADSAVKSCTTPETTDKSKNIVISKSSFSHFIKLNTPNETGKLSEPISDIANILPVITSSPTITIKRPASIAIGPLKSVPSKVMVTQGNTGKPVLLPKAATNVTNNKSNPIKSITIAQAKQMGLLTSAKLQQIQPQNIVVKRLSNDIKVPPVSVVKPITPTNILPASVKLDSSSQPPKILIRRPGSLRHSLSVSTGNQGQVIRVPVPAGVQNINVRSPISSSGTVQQIRFPNNKVQYVKLLNNSGTGIASNSNPVLINAGKTGSVSTVGNKSKLSTSNGTTIIIDNSKGKNNRMFVNGAGSASSATSMSVLGSTNTPTINTIPKINKNPSFASLNYYPKIQPKGTVMITMNHNNRMSNPLNNSQATSLRGPQTIKILPATLANTIKHSPGQRFILPSLSKSIDNTTSQSSSSSKPTENVVILPEDMVKQVKQEPEASSQSSASSNSELMKNDTNVEKSSPQNSTSDVPPIKPRKPCNCTKSQCLKLYCECFANGEFCHLCNCNSCLNTIVYEENRQHAIISCLERNPQAFKPKIENHYTGDNDRRHTKGCHCKRSNCMKNYCECYEAKISCSNNCKCVGCKNMDETAVSVFNMEKCVPELSTPELGTSLKDKLTDEINGAQDRDFVGTDSRHPFNFVTNEVVEATCQCLLAQAMELESKDLPDEEKEKIVIEEFGNCLIQIIKCARISTDPAEGKT